MEYWYLGSCLQLSHFANKRQPTKIGETCWAGQNLVSGPWNATALYWKLGLWALDFICLIWQQIVNPTSLEKFYWLDEAWSMGPGMPQCHIGSLVSRL